jgi:murein DD-endopeptidase MepM/ murein hydrolase activator NlpD
MIQYPFDKLPQITSPYGWRVHPTQKTKKHHNGVDLVAPAGSWVEAFAPGRVIHAGPSKLRKPDGSVGGFGFHVIMRHLINGEYVTSLYAHLRKDSIQVKVGQKIEAGTPLGRQGTTGDSTGEHLHFEICKGKTYRWSNDGSSFYSPLEFIKHAKEGEALAKKAKAATPESEPAHEMPAHSVSSSGSSSAPKAQ